MSVTSIRKVYNMYAGIYNLLFGGIFKQGRLSCTSIINQMAPQNATVLEIGIGTGLSLPSYRNDLHITGVDISEKMLEKAAQQIKDKQLENRVQLKVMDAADLQFADSSFDCIVAMYVASVVPDVSAFLQELTRVAKPNAEIIFVNHFSSQNRVIYFLEKKLSYLNRFIGFKSDFSIDSILQYAQLDVLRIKKTNLFGYWTLLHCKNKKSPSKTK